MKYIPIGPASRRALSASPALLLAALLLAACGSGKKLYIESEELAPLVVPEDLDQPDQRSALTIPGTPAAELAGRAEASPPVVLSSEEAAVSNTTVRYGAGALYLLVEDEPASVWRRLSFTLNRATMRLVDTDPQQQRYRFVYTQPPPDTEGGFWDTIFFWRGSNVVDFSGEYQVELRPDDKNPGATRVYLYRGDGRPADAEAADHITGVIQKRLG